MKGKNRKTILLGLLLSSVSVALSQSDKLVRPFLDFSLSDIPIRMPIYHGSFVRAGWEGTFKYRLKIKNARVEGIELLEKEVRSKATAITEDMLATKADYLLDDTIRSWRFHYGNPITTNLTIVYELDKELQDGELTYHIKYNEQGIVTRIKVMSGLERRLIGDK